MNNINIIIDDDIATSSITDNISTTFYIDYLGKCFPDNQWSDLTFPVLNMWAVKLMGNISSSNSKFRLYFMDGPFWLDVTKNGQNLMIECVNGRSERLVEYVIECSCFDFLNSLYDATKKLSYILYFNGMHIGAFESVYNQTLSDIKHLKALIRVC